jgi:hypothetical protein
VCPIGLCHPAKEHVGDDDEHAWDPRLKRNQEAFDDGLANTGLTAYHLSRPTGFFGSTLFNNYILHCVPDMRKGFADDEWVVLIIDGYRAHFDVDLYEQLYHQKVLVFMLAPNTTAYFMPNDASAWHGTLKRELRRELLRRFGCEDRTSWMRVLGEVVGRTLTSSHASSAFAQVGMVTDESVRDARFAATLEVLRRRASASGELQEIVEKYPNAAATLCPQVLVIRTNRREGKRKATKDRSELSAEMIGVVNTPSYLQRFKRHRSPSADGDRKSPSSSAAEKASTPRSPKPVRRWRALGNGKRAHLSSSGPGKKVTKAKARRRRLVHVAVAGERRPGEWPAHSFVVALPLLRTRGGSARKIRLPKKFI